MYFKHVLPSEVMPIKGPLSDADRERVQGLLSLLHWVAGVSYFKTAAPPLVSCETGVPSPAVAALLEALYSEGLGEFAYANGLASLPRPSFTRSTVVAHKEAPSEAMSSPTGADADADVARAGMLAEADVAWAGRQSDAMGVSGEGSPPSPLPVPRRVLVPVGGGKDSAVAIEIVRRSGCEATLFSIGDAPPIVRTVAAAQLPHLLVRRRLDPGLAALNGAGALNGHIPITAIVSCVALLTAALNGIEVVAMANERSASSGNVSWDGIEVNHQFSKGLRAERLLSAAVAEVAPELSVFSILRPASELSIARAFARLERYHEAFTSCNAIFRIDPSLRASSWCCDCPKCRFVFLALAPFSSPEHLRDVFGRDLLEEESQLEGFALLTATGGHKPFECVGEEMESLAAMRLLAADPRWAEHCVVRGLVKDVLTDASPSAGDPDEVFALSDEHEVPAALIGDVRAILGA